MVPMIRLTLLTLLVVPSSILVAGERKGKGGKGGSECRQKRSPCADGSHPTCPDGSKPDGGSRSDGSEPEGDFRPDGDRPDGGSQSDGSRLDEGSRPAGGSPDEARSNSYPPKCASGGEPLCQDGSAPQPPSRKLQQRGDGKGNNDRSDDDCDEGADMKMIVIVSVASSIALFCMCIVTYCWCRSFRNKLVIQKTNHLQSGCKLTPGAHAGQPTVCVASMHKATDGTSPASIVCVVGQPVPIENGKTKAEDVV